MTCARAAGIALLAWLTIGSASAGQQWRATAVASFDEVWNTINSSFYDPSFGGLDWAAVSRELRPLVESAASADEARTVIREMLVRLKRSHFALLSASMADALPGPATVPADVRIAPEGVAITRVTDPAATKAGLAPGQVLIQIDGRLVGDIVARAQGPDHRTKALDAWRLVTQALYGGVGSPVALRARSIDGKTIDVAVRRSLPPGETVQVGNLPPLHVLFEDRDLKTPGGHRIGFIAFNVWMATAGVQFDAAIDRYRSHDGLIIDLRGNLGGLVGMLRGVSGHVIDEPVQLGTMRTREGQLVLNVNPRLATTDGRRVKPFAGPVAILVDELTGSASEVFAGALQSLKRVRIIGRQTMGQALPALTRELPNGDVLLYAIADFVTSTGRSVEGGGVTPDTLVPLSLASLAAGKDDTADAALRWFDAEIRRR